MNFVEMNFLKIYNDLIEKAVNRKGNLQVYEKHHIIPVSIGGSDDISNIIELTPKEHFFAHKILVKIYPENKSIKYAYCMMAFTTIKANKKYFNKICSNRYYKVSSRDYEECRLMAKEFAKEKFVGKKYVHKDGVQKLIPWYELEQYLANGWIRGKKEYSEKTKEKIRIAAKLRVISEETHKKMSSSKTGENNPCHRRKSIHKDGILKKVYPEELSKYLEDGWILGQEKNSEKTRELKKNGKKDSNSGKKQVHFPNSFRTKYVDSSELEYWISLGWELGRGYTPYFIRKGNEFKIINSKELKAFLNIGWERIDSKTQTIIIKKKENLKLIYARNSCNYLDDGWEFQKFID